MATLSRSGAKLGARARRRFPWKGLHEAWHRSKQIAAHTCNHSWKPKSSTTHCPNQIRKWPQLTLQPRPRNWTTRKGPNSPLARGKSPRSPCSQTQGNTKHLQHVALAATVPTVPILGGLKLEMTSISSPPDLRRGRCSNTSKWPPQNLGIQ